MLVLNYYSQGEVVHAGAETQVVRAIHRPTGARVVVKRPASDMPITRVVVPRAVPKDPVPWVQLFTVVPQFARHGALVVPAAMLERPLRTADE